jgi:hypothetical protein
MSKNLASKYSKKIDERFTRASQAMLALNNDYEFTGVNTVNVYSIPTVPMNDYQRSGSNRYGEAKDLQRNVQSMTVKRDRGFTFIIDKGDKVQSEMVMDAGKALGRQTNEVMIPEFDAYVFRTLAYHATNHGGFSDTAITKSNAYEKFLEGMEYMGSRNVPDQGRVAFCSYRYANFLKQDPAFMRYGDKSQEMLVKGIIGEVDGCKIVKVPSSRLPAGCAFILCHPCAATAPKQLEEFKTHDNPPGISGWLVEGRIIYDCFVLDEKADAIYYHGSQAVLKNLNVLTAPHEDPKVTTKFRVLINNEAETGHTFVAKTYNSAEDAPVVAHDTALSDWTPVTSGAEVTPASGDALVMVAEIDGNSKPVGVGIAKINMA